MACGGVRLCSGGGRGHGRAFWLGLAEGRRVRCVIFSVRRTRVGKAWGMAGVRIEAEPEWMDAAARLVLRFGIERDPDAPLCLHGGAQGLCLFHVDAPKERLRVDFLAGRVGYRLGTRGHAREALLRAIGPVKARPHVLDATAGLGRETMLLACAGFRVTACERAPILAALLEDGLRRAAEGDATLGGIIRERISFHHGDACACLGTMPTVPDVVYLDPMFPPRRKSALVKKEMRLVRLAVGEGAEDAARIVEAARTAGVGRVVVKRPPDAPPLVEAPSHALHERTIRFDVYDRPPKA